MLKIYGKKTIIIIIIMLETKYYVFVLSSVFEDLYLKQNITSSCIWRPILETKYYVFVLSSVFEDLIIIRGSSAWSLFGLKKWSIKVLFACCTIIITLRSTHNSASCMGKSYCFWSNSAMGDGCSTDSKRCKKHKIAFVRS